MQTYKEYQPTGFDPTGYMLSDKQDWTVLPVGRNRDSGILDESNFQQSLDSLGGESDNVEVHRFGHWACGWFEIIIVKPGTKEYQMAEEIESVLSDYPVLDDNDYSERQWKAYIDCWESEGWKDFIDELKRELGFEFMGKAYDCLEKLEEKGKLSEFFESLIPSGEYFDSETGYPNISNAVDNCTRKILADFIGENRSK